MTPVLKKKTRKRMLKPPRPATIPGWRWVYGESYPDEPAWEIVDDRPPDDEHRCVMAARFSNDRIKLVVVGRVPASIVTAVYLANTRKRK